MYFKIFDSYEQALNEATTFKIVVTFRDGTQTDSSPIPLPTLKLVQSDIAACEEGGWFHMWNRHSNAISSIPAAHIKTIQIVLNKDTPSCQHS